jgi:mitogen-activated protein kinase 6
LSLEEPARPKIETHFRGHNPEAIDLLEKMLKFHPAQRITVDEALAHPFMAGLHNADDEPEANFHFSFEFEDQDLTSDQVRELIYA